jgi:serine/threonine protein kinase
VFSLGVVLWEMLAGQRLFAGDNEFQTLRNVLTLPVPPPSSRRPEVPRELDGIVARALERDRDARYPSAAAFAEALGAVLAAAPQAAEHGEGVRSLLTLLFGDPGAPDEPERFTLSFTSSDSMSMSSPGLAATGESPPEPPAAPPAPVAPAWWSRAGLPWLLAALVVVASVAWLLLR